MGASASVPGSHSVPSPPPGDWSLDGPVAVPACPSRGPYDPEARPEPPEVPTPFRSVVVGAVVGGPVPVVVGPAEVGSVEVGSPESDEVGGAANSRLWRPAVSTVRSSNASSRVLSVLTSSPVWWAPTHATVAIRPAAAKTAAGFRLRLGALVTV